MCVHHGCEFISFPQEGFSKIGSGRPGGSKMRKKEEKKEKEKKGKNKKKEGKKGFKFKIRR
jgi:hypothetical protein